MSLALFLSLFRDVFCVFCLFLHFYTPILFKSSCPEVFCKKAVLKNFAKFTGKHLCQRLFFNKVAGLMRATLLKNGLWHKCFPVNFAKFLRTPFLQSTSGGYFCLCFQKSLNCGTDIAIVFR